MDNNNQQELMFKLSMFEQQIQGIQQQMQAVDQAIVELNTLSNALEELKGKKDKEILAPIGKGIFTKAKLLSEELIVDVGGKNFVNKDIDSTKELISEQLKKLDNAKDELTKAMEEINQQLTQVMVDSQQAQAEAEEKPKKKSKK